MSALIVVAERSGSWLSKSRMEHFLVQMASTSTKNGIQEYRKLCLVCLQG
ncbi:hypothetical protein LguiB_024293 [Lonicera macranthoides]